jgi:hypothetical protein
MRWVPFYRSIFWNNRTGRSSQTAAPAILHTHMSKADTKPLKMFVVPCSCGTTFAVAENYDRQGTAWGRYLKCPNCENRHDPKNRLLQLGYQRAGYWKVEEC